MFNSIDVGKAAMKLAITTREEERDMLTQLDGMGIKGAAVDIGGNISQSIPKILERSLVASKRGGLIADEYAQEGAVIGACRDALAQVMMKASNLNVGGKIGIARSEHDICVCIFLSIGLLHLDEVVVGMGHRGLER